MTLFRTLLPIFLYLIASPGLMRFPAASAQSRPATDGYANFDVAVYARVYEVRQMADLDWLAERFDVMQKHVHVDKVYLETHRDTVVADEETLEKARRFFADRGVRTSGGITLFAYDNDAFIVESFLDEPADFEIVTDGRIATLRDLETEAVLSGEKMPVGPPGGWFVPPDAGKTIFKANVKPHSYRVFKAD